MPGTKKGEFAKYGVTLATGYEWAGEEAPNRGKIVLSVHRERFNYKVLPPRYSVFEDGPLSVKSPDESSHCRERTRMLKRAMEEKRLCHVVITPRKIEGTKEKINACPYAQQNMANPSGRRNRRVRGRGSSGTLMFKAGKLKLFS